MTVDGRRPLGALIAGPLALLAAVLTLALPATPAPAQTKIDLELATQPDGTAHLAWLRHDRDDETGGTGILERSWTAGGTLRPLQWVSPADAVVRELDMAVDGGGTAVFVWTQQFGERAVVRARRRFADGSLGTVMTLSATPGVGYSPRVAVSPNGDAVFVWVRPGGPTASIEARRLSRAGTLGPALTLSAAGYASREPEVAVDGSGNAVAVWVRRGGDPVGEVAQARYIAANGALGVTQTVSGVAARVSTPLVEFDAAGNALMAWLRDDEGRMVPQLRRRAADGTYRLAQSLAVAGSQIQLAVAPGGGAIVTWIADGAAWARRRAPDGTLGSGTRMSAPGFEVFEAPAAVAVDRDGNAMIAWTVTGDGPPYVQGRWRSVSGTFGALRTLSSDGASSFYPAVGMAAAGNASIAWSTAEAEQRAEVDGRRRLPGGTLTDVRRLSP